MIPCLSIIEKYLSHQIINIAIVHTFTFWWVTLGAITDSKGICKDSEGLPGRFGGSGQR